MIPELYEKYYQELFRYAFSLTHNRTAAEDIVQESFMRAIEHSETLNGLDGRKSRAWLYQTVKNLFIDKARRAAASPEPNERTVAEDDTSTILVEQLCDGLTGLEQVIFRLRYFGGYNSRELGQMFDLPPSTVRAKLAHARKQLREMIKE